MGENDQSQMKDAIWSFLKKFHLRIFTFSIFLKQSREQKKCTCILVAKYADAWDGFVLLCKTVEHNCGAQILSM